VVERRRIRVQRRRPVSRQQQVRDRVLACPRLGRQPQVLAQRHHLQPVIGDHVGQFVLAVPPDLLHPFRRAQVFGPPHRFGLHRIGDVPDQNVSEAELFLAFEGGPLIENQQVLHDQRPERIVHLGLAGDDAHGPEPEDLPHDGRRLQDELLRPRQGIDARRDHRVDGVGDRHFVERYREDPPIGLFRQGPAIEQRPQHLFHEEHVAVRPLQQPFHERTGCRLAVQDPLHQRAALLAKQGIKKERRGGARADHPHRAPLEQLGPGEHQQQHGRLADPKRHLLEKVERDVLGGVHVLDNHQERSSSGHGLEERAHAGKERVPRQSVSVRTEPQDRQQRGGDVRDPQSVGRVPELPARAVQRVSHQNAGFLADHFPERPERHPGPVGQRPTAEDADALNPGTQLPHQARFAHPGRSQDADHESPAPAPYPPGMTQQHVEFLRPTHERGRSHRAFPRRGDPEQFPGQEGSGRAFHRQRRHRTHVGDVAERTHGAFA